MRDRLRQRALISLLQTHDGPPTILATQIFFLFDVKPSLAGITDNMTPENVLVAVGTILRSRQRFHEDVTAWAKELCQAAGLPFNVPSGETEREESTTDPPPTLSVVSSQPTTSKIETQPPLPKRKSRRVYLELAIQCLEKGITYKALVDSIMAKFPNLNRETVSTFVSDVQNPRYTPIRDRKVLKLPPDGRLIFEDCVRPALTVIENPNAGTGKADVEHAIVAGKKVNSSME